MIPIKKGSVPRAYTQEIRDFEKAVGRSPVWDEIRCKRKVVAALLAEQGGICAYCMSRIGDANALESTRDERAAHVEHLLPQSRSSHGEDIDYHNMVAVCSGERGEGKKALCCDRARGNQELTVNPTRPETLRSIRYRANGRVYSEDPDIDKDLNAVLNLNGEETGLPMNRKAAVDRLFAKFSALGKRGGDRAVRAYCRKRLDALSHPDADGRYVPYVGTLRYFLQRRLGR